MGTPISMLIWEAENHFNKRRVSQLVWLSDALQARYRFQDYPACSWAADLARMAERLQLQRLAEIPAI